MQLGVIDYFSVRCLLNVWVFLFLKATLVGAKRSSLVVLVACFLLCELHGQLRFWICQETVLSIFVTTVALNEHLSFISMNVLIRLLTCGCKCVCGEAEILLEINYFMRSLE